LEIGDASVTAMEWLDGAGTVMAATTDGANTLSRGFNLMEYVEAILPEYLILAAERSSVVVRSPTSDQEFTIRMPTDPIATSDPPGISHAPDGTHVLADDDGETVFALAISVYPDGCTGAPDRASSSDKEQMDAIFAALAGPLSPES
jgi:hypothetical protein